MRSHQIALAAISFALVLTVGTVTFAQSSTTAPTGAPPPGEMGGPPPHGGNPAMHAAFEACKGTVAKDAQGHPDHEAMKACLKSKGFTPPERGEHGAGGPPPGDMGAGGPPPGSAAATTK